MLRKGIRNKHLKAGGFHNDTFVQKFGNLDEGYKTFKNVRTTPAYWQAAKKDLFAMIRMLRIPTWFHSVSCAETRCIFLFKILGLTVDAKTYAEENIEALTWEEKCRLVCSDPVTCARQFHHIVNPYVSNLLHNKDILGCTDYFFRVEF